MLKKNPEQEEGLGQGDPRGQKGTEDNPFGEDPFEGQEVAAPEEKEQHPPDESGQDGEAEEGLGQWAKLEETKQGWEIGKGGKGVILEG